jgi:hypothetical protein
VLRSPPISSLMWSLQYFSGVWAMSRLQWPRDLTHEAPSPARILVSWFRIQIEAWMSVCRQRPCGGLIPSPRSPTDSVYIKKLKKRAGPGWMDAWMDGRTEK